ncbi:hypothetical protein L218DRAFT_42956 [Marasmius fiardii PR-910]|nr:hypothetical protein L218DRAFT_42956 [Marasmius fiardii PR-910]
MGKFYAVCVGRDGPKIYNTWEECKANTARYSGAKYKAFSSITQARDWIVRGRFGFRRRDY